jgi:hypothetical protein
VVDNSTIAKLQVVFGADAGDFYGSSFLACCIERVATEVRGRQASKCAQRAHVDVCSSKERRYDFASLYTQCPLQSVFTSRSVLASGDAAMTGSSAHLTIAITHLCTKNNNGSANTLRRSATAIENVRRLRGRERAGVVWCGVWRVCLVRWLTDRCSRRCPPAR